MNTIINYIVKELNTLTGRPVILDAQHTNRPTRPYVGYSIGVLADERVNNKFFEVVASSSEDFTYDIEDRLENQYKLTLSFNAYANTQAEAQDLIMEVRDWFIQFGVLGLQQKKVAIVEVLAIEAREILEVDKYDRRRGFDVILRIGRETVQIIPTIERWEEKTS